MYCIVWLNQFKHQHFSKIANKNPHTRSRADNSLHVNRRFTVEPCWQHKSSKCCRNYANVRSVGTYVLFELLKWTFNAPLLATNISRSWNQLSWGSGQGRMFMTGNMTLSHYHFVSFRMKLSWKCPWLSMESDVLTLFSLSSGKDVCCIQYIRHNDQRYRGPVKKFHSHSLRWHGGHPGHRYVTATAVVLRGMCNSMQLSAVLYHQM